GRLRAVIKHNGNGTYALTERKTSFADVRSTHWAKPYIDVMAARWVIQGKSPSTFDPSGYVTRAEFAAMITRAMGLMPASLSKPRFADVPAGAWYASEVEAAYQAGIIS